MNRVSSLRETVQTGGFDTGHALVASHGACRVDTSNTHQMAVDRVGTTLASVAGSGTGPTEATSDAVQ